MDERPRLSGIVYDTEWDAAEKRFVPVHIRRLKDGRTYDAGDDGEAWAIPRIEEANKPPERPAMTSREWMAMHPEWGRRPWTSATASARASWWPSTRRRRA